MGESLHGKTKENHVKAIPQYDSIQSDELTFSLGMCRSKRDNFTYLEDITSFIYLSVPVTTSLCSQNDAYGM